MKRPPQRVAVESILYVLPSNANVRVINYHDSHGEIVFEGTVAECLSDAPYVITEAEVHSMETIADGTIKIYIDNVYEEFRKGALPA